MKAHRDLFLVTGAAGWIGRAVCDFLLRAGARVASLDLIAPRAGVHASFIGGLDALAAPPPALGAILAQTCAVIHCAGRAHRPIETPAEVLLFEETNVEGTRALIAACRSAGIKRVVYVSTIAGYDWDGNLDAIYAEDSPMCPASAYARTKIEGERLLCKSGLDWRVVRLATVFGDGDRANFAKLAKALKSQRFFLPGNGCARKSVIPFDLAGRVLAEMALIKSPRHRVINAAMPAPPTLREICENFSSICDFPRARRIPLGMLRSVAFCGDVAARFQVNLPLTSPTLQKLTRSTVVDTTRLNETLSDIQWPSFAEAVRAASAYYRSL